MNWLSRGAIATLFSGWISLSAAGPMTHLWVAEQFCEICEIKDPRVIQGILVGTEYPDIRYITKNPRHLTHPQITDIRDVHKSSTPFEAGMRLHAWLDLVREAYVAKEVYEAVALYDEGHPATLLKFIEEEILADSYDGRQWYGCFSEILSEEYAYADKDAILKWHMTIQATMNARPSWLLWGQSYMGPKLGLSVHSLYNWSYLLPELKTWPVFTNHMEGLLKHILEELKRYKEPEIVFLKELL